MPTISPSQASPGEEITADKINNPVNTIAGLVNGNLDSDNIASLTGTKITSQTLPATALDSTARGGWITGLTVPNTVTYLGNRSYQLAYAASILGYKSVGMRNMYTRTVTAPTQCTDLESSSSQYWSKSSPTGISFTDDFTCMAWVKLESYTQGVVLGRRNGSTGDWRFYVSSDGRVSLVAGSTSTDQIQSYQSIPLNRWVHIAASLDMSGSTGTVYIDGVSVPAAYTNQAVTALVQSGDLRIGTDDTGGNYFDGKIAQVAVFNAILSAATVRSYSSQTLSGSETNCVGCWTLNGNANDSNANANNMTAFNSATATNVDAPYAGGSSQQSYTAGTREFSVTTLISSDGLTETVQVPEGYALPTTGGISAMAYAGAGAIPYGFPASSGKWIVKSVFRADFIQNSPTSNVWYNLTTASGTSGGMKLNYPVGEWIPSYQAIAYVPNSVNPANWYLTLSTSSSSETDTEMSSSSQVGAASAGYIVGTGYRRKDEGISLSAATDYFLNIKTSTASASSLNIRGAVDGMVSIVAEFAYV